jgi:hypothetical protein
MTTSSRSAFENVKDQIGYCGIWCGSCIIGNGALAELTTRYEKLLAAYGLEEWAPGEFDHEGFSQALDIIRRCGSCPGCRKGGGRDNCEIRTCAVERGSSNCAECDAGAACGPRELLEKMSAGAMAAGLFVKTDAEDPEQAIPRWQHEISQSWPSSLLFMEE